MIPPVSIYNLETIKDQLKSGYFPRMPGESEADKNRRHKLNSLAREYYNVKVCRGRGKFDWVDLEDYISEHVQCFKEVNRERLTKVPSPSPHPPPPTYKLFLYS